MPRHPQAQDRGDIDDRAAALPHGARGPLRDKKAATQIGCHRPVPVFQRIIQRRAGQRYAGIVHDDIRHSAGKQIGDRVGAGDIQRTDFGLPACGYNLVAQRCQCLDTTGLQHHMRTPPRKEACEMRSQTRRRPGDDDMPAFQIEHDAPRFQPLRRA